MGRGTMLTINIIGGIAVLGSYAYGAMTHPGQTDLLWGNLPDAVRGIYTTMMFPAAIGYLTLTAYLLLGKPEQLQLSGASALPLLNANYAIFLLTATLWMPLCWIAVDGPAQWLAFPIQAVLALTGLAALAFLVLLWKLEDRSRPTFRLAALVGAGCLFLQCGILDAIIWPRFFVIG